MKKICLFLFASLLITSIGFAASLESGQIAELYELNEGRSAIVDQSQIVNIWHTGSSVGAVGVSATSVGSDISILFYEDGAVITATRFGGSATVDCDANTAEKVASLINSDTSKRFKASLGRDATPGTSTAHLLYLPVVNLYSTEQLAMDSEADGISPTTVLKEDLSSSKILRAGFQADERITYRLQSIEETTEGTGVHIIKVWDGERVVYRRVYGSKSEYSGIGTPGASGYIAAVTPLTVNFATLGSKGLSARKGQNLTVTSQWSTTQAGTAEQDENLSIIVGNWKE